LALLFALFAVPLTAAVALVELCTVVEAVVVVVGEGAAVGELDGVDVVVVVVIASSSSTAPVSTSTQMADRACCPS
jgi:hypothetical protein